MDFMNVHLYNASKEIPQNFTFYERMKQPDWIAPVTVNLLILPSCLWILISLIHHGIKTGKWIKKCAKPSEKLNSGHVYTSVVMGAVFCLLHSLCILIYYCIGYQENENVACDVLLTIVFGFYAGQIFSTMTFLWLRQRIFYSNPMLKLYYSKTIKAISIVSIVIIYSGGLCGFILLRVVTSFSSSDDGCIARFKYQPSVLYFVVIFVTNSSGYFTLLVLFIYALRKATSSSTPGNPSFNSKPPCSNQTSNSTSSENHLKPPALGRESDSRMSVNSQNIPYSSTTNQQRMSKKSAHPDTFVTKVLRKTFILALAAVISDCSVVIIFASTYYPRVYIAMYNINAFLNLTFVLLSFAKCKHMIFSPCFS